MGLKHLSLGTMYARCTGQTARECVHYGTIAFHIATSLTRTLQKYPCAVMPGVAAAGTHNALITVEPGAHQ